MSLLLDALKRAEQEKQARQGERESAAPHPAGATSKARLELQSVAQPEAAASRPASTAASAAGPAVAVRERASGSRRVLWIAGAVVMVVIALAGGYVWMSVDALAPKPAPGVRAPVPRPVLPAATEIGEKIEPSRVAESPVSKAQGGDVPAKPGMPAAPREPAALERAPVQPATLLQPSLAAQRPRVPPEIDAGYTALRHGDFGLARRSYAAALASDPTNLDAALGLATAEARIGNREAAATHYRLALEIDPRNATALAGLAALTEFSRPEMLEPYLMREIAERPESAALHFMLGNLYASQSRWRQAQSAFFEAHRLDPGNADIVYNLAVSLDHLGQPRTAAGFYRRALEAARAQATQFDPASITRRLAELESAP